MKYLRHAPTAYWLVVCVALVAVLCAGFALSRGSQEAKVNPQTLNQSAQDVFLMRNRVADVHRVAAPPATGLATWSEETARQADVLAERRESSRGEGDDLALIYRALATDARSLAEADPSDTSAIITGVRLVEADSDALVSVLNGATAEDARPLVVEDMTVTDQVPGVVPVPVESPETPGAPSVPQVPVVPADPASPPGRPGVPVIPVPQAGLEGQNTVGAP